MAGWTAFLASLATTTLPILWLGVRLASILSSPAIWSHLQKQRGGKSSLAFLLHVYIGIGTMFVGGAVLVYSLMPTVANQTVAFGRRPMLRVILTALSLGLGTTNATVFWLLPARHDFKRYRVSPRQMTRGLALLQGIPLQMIAMAGTPLCILWPSPTWFVQSVAAFCLVLYLFTMLLSTYELCFRNMQQSDAWQGDSWEDATWWGRAWFASIPQLSPNRPRSKLTHSFVHSNFQNQTAIFVMLLVIGGLAGYQALHLISMADPQQFLTDGEYIAFGNFYVGLVLYQTLVMSAGVFTMSQALFRRQELEEKYKQTGDVDLVLQIAAHQRGLWWELVLTQFIPLLAMGVGPAYTGLSTSEFWRMTFTFR